MSSARPSSFPDEMSKKKTAHSLTVKSSVDCEGLLLQSEDIYLGLQIVHNNLYLHKHIMDNLILNPICITISS